MVRIIEPIVEIENIDGEEIMKKIEKACRTCYRSEKLIKDDSYHNLIRNCINKGHESVLEHEKITVRMITEIGAYKDFTRHRLSSFSIESTRYCNYSNDKFNNEISIINANYITDPSIYDVWLNGCKMMEQQYMIMKKLGGSNDECRQLLNHSVAAEVVMTCNIREWRHVLSLRCSKAAHPSLRVVFIPLLIHFKKIMPELFDDIAYDETFDKENYASLIIN